MATKEKEHRFDDRGGTRTQLCSVKGCWQKPMGGKQTCCYMHAQRARSGLGENATNVRERTVPAKLSTNGEELRVRARGPVGGRPTSLEIVAYDSNGKGRKIEVTPGDAGILALREALTDLAVYFELMPASSEY